MISAKEKAKELIDKYLSIDDELDLFLNKTRQQASKECAIIAVENEYYSLRELLFNLKSVRLIENDKVYLIRLQQLIDEEKEVKKEIENFNTGKL